MDAQKVCGEIKRQFPGRNNRALRARIFKLAETGNVLGLRRTVALTERGLTGLKRVQEVIGRD
ncbi:MAG: hypothetical protein A2Y38_02430 [Spirochaetes bacterium GWB1_59_5]|nr:MAG: hypothetical protein A2Y38_02430 [Spirochaetes bacterium GWB1_59_5]